MRIRPAFAMVLGIMGSAGLVGLADAATFSAGVLDKEIVIYLRAATETTLPFLSLDPATPSPRYYYLTTEAVSGSVNTVQASTYGNPTPITADFELKDGLPETCYLNLTRPITLRVTPKVNPQGVDGPGNTHRSLHYSAELVQENVLIAAKEWISDDVGGTSIANIGSLAHPEFRLVEKSKPLTLRITRWTGTGPFGVYLNPPPLYPDSFLRLSCLPFDPLAAGLYVEGSSLTVSQTGTEGGGKSELPTTPAASPYDSMPIGSSAAALLLVGAPPRRRSMPHLVLLMMLFSGCVGSAPTEGPDLPPDDTSDPGVNRSYEGNDTLGEKGLGAIRGWVRDGKRAGVPPLGGVHVTVLGTSLFNATDKFGGYGFDNLLAKQYVLKFDRDGYVSAQVTADVLAGKVLFLNVTMQEPGAEGLGPDPGLGPHTHPEWNPGETKRLIQDVMIRPTTTETSYFGVPLAETVQDDWACIPMSSSEVACSGRAPIDPAKRILPGTIDVEVVLSWPTESKTVPQKLGIRFDNLARNRSAPSDFVARGPNQPFHIAIFPNEADPGHQQYTDWQFWVTVPTQIMHRVTLIPSFSGPPVFLAPEIRMQVFAHKGVEPLEPKHVDLWKGQNSTRLVDGVAKAMSVTQFAVYPEKSPVWTPTVGSFVGTGRSHMRAWLNWTKSTYAAVPDPTDTQWGLLCLPGNQPTYAGWDQWIPATRGPVQGNSAEFSLEISEEQADQYYFAASHWRFALDDGKPNLATAKSSYVSPNGGYGISSFNLTVVVHRAPAS